MNTVIPKGTDQTWYRQNASFYTHYGYKDKYFADLSVVASASNKLAPGHQWLISHCWLSLGHVKRKFHERSFLD